MRKKILMMLAFLGAVTLIGCSNDNDSEKSSSNLVSRTVVWYDMSVPYTPKDKAELPSWLFEKEKDFNYPIQYICLGVNEKDSAYLVHVAGTHSENGFDTKAVYNYIYNTAGESLFAPTVQAYQELKDKWEWVCYYKSDTFVDEANEYITFFNQEVSYEPKDADDFPEWIRDVWTGAVFEGRQGDKTIYYFSPVYDSVALGQFCESDGTRIQPDLDDVYDFVKQWNWTARFMVY